MRHHIIDHHCLKSLLLMSLVGFLGACSSPVTRVPVEDRSTESSAVAKQKPAVTTRADDKTIRAEQTTSSPAVVALLDESRSRMRADDHANAVRSVERALKLEPKNPRLWHQLALIRFKEKNWQQAIALAQKSNSLAANDPELQKANEELIKKANKHVKNRV